MPFKVGSFDRYQYGLLCFIWVTTYVCGLNYYNQIFIFSSPPHREAEFNFKLFVPIFMYITQESIFEFYQALAK